MDKIFINIIHVVVKDDIAETKLLIISKILNSPVDIIENLLVQLHELRVMLEGILEHERTSLDPINHFQYDKNEDEGPE